MKTNTFCLVLLFIIVLSSFNSCATLKKQTPKTKNSKVELPPNVPSDKYSKKRG